MPTDSKLYWCDAQLDYIASMNVDGSDRRTLTTSFGSHFFDLIVVHEELLVSDWTTRLAQHSEGLSFSYNVSFQRVSNDKVTSNTDILPAQCNRRL